MLTKRSVFKGALHTSQQYGSFSDDYNTLTTLLLNAHQIILRHISGLWQGTYAQQSEIHVGEEKMIAEKGQALSTPDKSAHAIRNIGDSPMELLVVRAPRPLLD